jgi:hypothetical protein
MGKMQAFIFFVVIAVIGLMEVVDCGVLSDRVSILWLVKYFVIELDFWRLKCCCEYMECGRKSGRNFLKLENLKNV